MCLRYRDFKAENNNQHNFDAAIRLAHKNNINLAISNDAFELWFLLHFSYYDSETHRRDFKDMLTHKIKGKYEKNDPKLYDKLENLLPKAIKHSEKLWQSYDEQMTLPNSPTQKLIIKHNQNPSTTVHQLISRLIEYLDRDC